MTDDDLELSQDLTFQKREWFIQRIGWACMLALAIAGLAGVLGEGPAADTAVRSQHSELVVRYERVTRHGAPTRIELRVAGRSNGGIWLNTDYLRALQAIEFVPAPNRSVVGADRVFFFFDLTPTATIQLIVTPDRIGRRHVHIGLEGGPTLQFRQFVLP